MTAPDLHDDGQLVGALRGALAEGDAASAGRCAADWGSATESQRCTWLAGHGEWHRDSLGREWNDAGKLRRELRHAAADRAMAEVPGNFSCAECGGAGSAPTHRGDCVTGKRHNYAAGLRMLAAAIETHPEIELPYHGSSTELCFFPASRDAAGAILRALPGDWSAEKWRSDNGLRWRLTCRLAGLKILVTTERDAAGACTCHTFEESAAAFLLSLLAPRPAEAQDGAQ